MLEEIFKDQQRTLCIESRIDRPDPPYIPLFFYHVPRTGGISFYHALSGAIRFVNNQADRLGALGSDTEVLRFDAPRPDRHHFRAGYALVASHNAFGFHRKFRQSFLLTTIIRDPFGRVRSDYTYTCMRRQKTGSEEEFRASFRSEININRAVKQLAGHTHFDQPAPPDIYLRAIDTLTEQFHSYVTHHEISALIGLYLSYYRLPNIIMDRINTTTPDYRLAADACRGELDALNDQDVRLYDFVRNQPRRPDLGLCSRASHPVTVILNEVSNTDRSVTRWVGIDTARLARLIEDNQGSASSLTIPLNSAP